MAPAPPPGCHHLMGQDHSETEFVRPRSSVHTRSTAGPPYRLTEHWVGSFARSCASQDLSKNPRRCMFDPALSSSAHGTLMGKTPALRAGLVASSGHLAGHSRNTWVLRTLYGGKPGSGGTKPGTRQKGGSGVVQREKGHSKRAGTTRTCASGERETFGQGGPEEQ